MPIDFSPDSVPATLASLAAIVLGFVILGSSRFSWLDRTVNYLMVCWRI